MTTPKKSIVIWFTGLPCSGKTTLSTQLEKTLADKNLLVHRLDGDQIRKGLNSDLDFSIKGREENIRRIGEVAKLFADKGAITLVAVISPFKKDRMQVRNILDANQFIEVYVDCPLEVCEQRDVKGHYQQARKGEIADFTGISSPYEPPDNPEIHLKTHSKNSDECIQEINQYLTICKHIPA